MTYAYCQTEIPELLDTIFLKDLTKLNANTSTSKSLRMKIITHETVAIYSARIVRDVMDGVSSSANLYLILDSLLITLPVKNHK
jgi:hypothetical protein